VDENVGLPVRVVGRLYRSTMVVDYI